MKILKKVSALVLSFVFILSLSSLTFAAGSVKPGNYASDNVFNGEFSWSLTLNADNSFVFNLMDFHGYYDMTGSWTEDGAGNITLNDDNGSVIALTGGGTDTLTIPFWPSGNAMDGTELYYDASSAPASSSAAPEAPVQQGLTVSPTPSTVFVNGEEKAFEAYNIEGSNYFKLRDLAYVLNGTNKQFEVGFNSQTDAIALESGAPYTVSGGEMTLGDGQAKQALPTASAIYLDGAELSLTVYNIGGNNFFKLVDLMEYLNVGVTFDRTTGNIGINTDLNFEGVVEINTNPVGENTQTPSDLGVIREAAEEPEQASESAQAGDFVRAEIASDDSSEDIATNVWGFRIVVAGNLENGPEPDISDVKLFIDGTETSVIYEYVSVTYHENRDQTTFNFLFDQEFTQKPAKYWAELTVNGETVQSRVTNWLADGLVVYE